MIHKEKSPLAGQKVKVKETTNEIGGNEILVEDWWDRVAGKSWMNCDGNPACLNYAMRTGFSKVHVPTNNEVLYGKIDGLGYLVHATELESYPIHHPHAIK